MSECVNVRQLKYSFRNLDAVEGIFHHASSPQSGRLNTVNRVYVEIIEEPLTDRYRFRYENEGRGACRIKGVNSTDGHTTYPTITIHGYRGAAFIFVSLISIHGPPYYPHPHKLVGEDCKGGVFQKLIDVTEMPYCFSDLRIQCVKRKQAEESLKERERRRIDPFGTGFSHSSDRNKISFNAVRLCFQVLLPGSNGNFYDPVPLTPVISIPIYDSKFDLHIAKLSHCSAPVCGGQEVILLGAIFNEDDIEIVFYEEDDKKIIWTATVDIFPGDVYSRKTIIFKTPPYKNPYICKKINCFIQLRRPSDGTISTPKHFTLLPRNEDLSSLSKNLEELHRIGQFCDFIIKVKDREFPVHKAILAARSPVFESMLLHDMKEKITSMVHIRDCEPDIFEDFLFYVYSGKSEKISSSNVTGLYEVAEKYDVKFLKKACVQFMKGSLSSNLIIDVLTLAVKYTDEELLEYAIEFFLSNYQLIISTTKWQELLVENPVLANELMEKIEIVSLMET